MSEHDLEARVRRLEDEAQIRLGELFDEGTP